MFSLLTLSLLALHYEVLNGSCFRKHASKEFTRENFGITTIGNDDILAETQMENIYIDLELYNLVFRGWNDIDINNKGSIILDDWMSVKDNICPDCDDLLWKKIFYFAKHISKQKNDTMCPDDFYDLCSLSYKPEEYREVMEVLRGDL